MIIEKYFAVQPIDAEILFDLCLLKIVFSLDG